MTDQRPWLQLLGSTWDSYEIMDRLRRESPVVYVEELHSWMLSSYDDVVQVVNDPARFGSMPADLAGEVPVEVRDSLPHGYAPWQPALVNTDPPEHTRIRRLAQKPLTPKAVAGLEGEVRAAANRLVDSFVQDRQADLASRYAALLPVQLLGSILGIPTADLRAFHEWTLGINELFIPTITEQRRLELAREQVKFNDYILTMVADRRTAPGTDVISGLILAQEQNERSLTDNEILGVVGQLIIAGFETSAGGISFALHELGTDRELYDRVRENPAVVPQFVEESLRRLTPARAIMRRVKEDVEFGGHRIPKGSNIYALVQSANNDPAHFGCPARIDLDRPAAEMRKSLHFGAGNHTCIGMPLARLDIRVAIETVLDRLPNLRFVPGQDTRVHPDMFFHRPVTIDFEWDA